MARTILPLLILVASVSPVVAGPWHLRRSHHAPVVGGVQVFGGGVSSSAFYAPATTFGVPATTFGVPASTFASANTLAVSPLTVQTFGVAPATLSSNFAVQTSPQFIESQSAISDRLLELLIGGLIGGLRPQPPISPPVGTGLEARVAKLEQDVLDLQQRLGGTPDTGEGGLDNSDDDFVEPTFSVRSQSVRSRSQAAMSPYRAYDATMRYADQVESPANEAMKMTAIERARQSYKLLRRQKQNIDRRYEQVRRQKIDCDALLRKAAERLKFLKID